MDFFNSLSEVAKNSHNFKKWEDKQHQAEAQREELHKRHQHTPEQLKDAQNYGETIIDVVDFMDNHSESVAENVETATQPLISMSPILGLLGVGAVTYKKIFKPAKKAIEEADDTFYFKNEKTQQLIKEIERTNYEAARARGSEYCKIYIGEYGLRDKKMIAKIEDASLRKQAEELLKQYSKKVAPHWSKIKYLSWTIPLAASVAAFIGANIYAAKLQVDSSKIARFQARKALEDPKAFVNYTPEQLAEAKKELEEHPELLKLQKKGKLSQNFFKSIYSVLKDRKAYTKAIKNDSDESKKVARQLTPEELKAAEKDKEVIQRTVRLINNEAEKYSENMEVAANVIMASTPFLGAAVGWVISKIATMTGVIDKTIASNVKKLGSDEAIKAYEDYIKIKPKEPGKNGAWQNFFGEMLDSGYRIEQKARRAAGQAIDAVKPRKRDIMTPIKRFMTAVGATKLGRNVILATAGGLVTGLVGQFIGLKLQKSAARAGRYTAKRELEKDPKNFIGYTPEEMEEVKDVKNPKKKPNKIKEYALFIPTVLKQYYAYNKYKKNDYVKNQALREQLKKTDVSDKQLKDAKNLQRKLFNTFEKVDDNSQIYSESMEAATEIAQPFVYYGAFAAMLSPLVIFGVQAARGKYTPKQLIDKITNAISKRTGLLKSKRAMKYLDDINKMIPDKVRGTNVPEYYREMIANNPKKAQSIHAFMQELENNPADTIKGYKELLKRIKKDISISSDDEVKELLKTISNEHFNNRIVRNLELDSMDKKYLEKILPRIEKMIDDIPEDKIRAIVDTLIKEYKANPEKFIYFIQQGSIKSILVTPSMKKTMAAIGVGWVAANFVVSYIIEQILADMQLKAGRLGVMKAMEALDDPAYYANIEPTETAQQKPASPVNNQSTANNSSLLNKFRQVS